MKKQIRQVIIPSGFDVAIAALLGLVLAALFNAGKILINYGYGSSVDTLHHEVGGGVVGILSRIDDFRFTTSVVSFLVWAVIGLVTLFVISSLLKGAGSIRANMNFLSSSYVKPGTFQKKSFVHAQILNAALLMVGFIVLFTVSTLLLKGTWPYANAMIRHLNSTLPVLQQIVDVVIGCGVYVASCGVILYLGRLTVRRQVFFGT